MSMENMVQCPYNRSHLILKSRIAGHLIKCRRQHTGEKFETCPFNSTHDIPVPELQYHIQTCPDRKILENYIYVMEEPQPLDKQTFNVDLPPAPENWDEECTSGSYLDVKDEKLEKEMVFRKPVGLPKSERRAFFHSEVQKFGRASGLSGPSGHSDQGGPSGLSGPRGPTGPRGFRGPSGHSDQSGPSGHSDQCGPSGHSDQSGPSGHSDQSGPSGHSGLSGPRGLTVPRGSRGPSGHSSQGESSK